jgi:hypothetical protein
LESGSPNAAGRAPKRWRAIRPPEPWFFASFPLFLNVLLTDLTSRPVTLMVVNT